MIKNKAGEAFQYENVLYTIGEWIQCSELSDYAGLAGIITEIRDGTDKETDNRGPEITCCFQSPQEKNLIKKIENKFSSLYGVSKKIE